MKKSLKIVGIILIIIIVFIGSIFIYDRATINNQYKIGEKKLTYTNNNLS